MKWIIIGQYSSINYCQYISTEYFKIIKIRMFYPFWISLVHYLIAELVKFFVLQFCFDINFFLILIYSNYSSKFL